MSNKLFFIAFSVLLFDTNGYTDNTVNLSGSGNSIVTIDTSAATNSLIDLYQVGSSSVGQENQITASQSGSNDIIRVGQGALYGQLTGQWTEGSPVTQNTVTINQSGVNNLVANVVQNGVIASTVQANQAASVPYTLNVSQSGGGQHTAIIETTSNYNGSGVEVNQSGLNNSTIITGMSGGSAVVNQSVVGGNVLLTGQTAGSISVTQSTSNSAVSVANFGSSTPLIINQ